MLLRVCALFGIVTLGVAQDRDDEKSAKDRAFVAFAKENVNQASTERNMCPGTVFPNPENRNSCDLRAEREFKYNVVNTEEISFLSDTVGSANVFVTTDDCGHSWAMCQDKCVRNPNHEDCEGTLRGRAMASMMQNTGCVLPSIAYELQPQCKGSPAAWQLCEFNSVCAVFEGVVEADCNIDTGLTGVLSFGKDGLEESEVGECLRKNKDTSLVCADIVDVANLCGTFVDGMTESLLAMDANAAEGDDKDYKMGKMNDAKDQMQRLQRSLIAETQSSNTDTKLRSFDSETMKATTSDVDFNTGSCISDLLQIQIWNTVITACSDVKESNGGTFDKKGGGGGSKRGEGRKLSMVSNRANSFDSVGVTSLLCGNSVTETDCPCCDCESACGYGCNSDVDDIAANCPAVVDAVVAAKGFWSEENAMGYCSCNTSDMDDAQTGSAGGGAATFSLLDIVELDLEDEEVDVSRRSLSRSLLAAGNCT